MSKKKQSKFPKLVYTPKYGDGGKKFGEYAGNTGAGLLDIAATTLGMPNVADQLYKGNSANQFQNVAGGVGQLGAAAAPMLLNTFVPGSGMAVSAGQKALGAVDKGVTQSNQAIDPQTGKPYTGTGDAVGQSIGQLGNTIAPMLMARNGGIMKYGEGGLTPDQWNQQYIAKGWKVDPRANTSTITGKYPAYYNPASINFTPDAMHTTNYKASGAVDAFGRPDPSHYATYELPIKTSTIDTKFQQWNPTGSIVDYQGQKAGSFTKHGDTDPNARYIFSGGQYVKMSTGGTMPEAGITSNQHVYENYKTKTNGMMIYANGGMQTFGPNAEVEKQENTLNPDGSTYQFDGASHENGGIQTNLEPGTIIFSDKLKLPGTRKTFADLNKPNMTKKEDKILESPSSNRERLTAELMKSAKNKNSQSLFEQQEALKESKYKSQLENDLFTCGGMMKYSNGGIHIKPENRGKFTAAADRAGMGVQEYASHIMAHKENYSSTLVKRANFAKNAAGWNHAMGGIQKYEGGGYGPNLKPENLPMINTPMNTTPMDYGQGMELRGNTDIQPIPQSLPTSMNGEGTGGPNWSNIATQGALALGQNIGNIYDLSRANKVEDTTYNRVTPSTLSSAADLATNRRMYADSKTAAIGGSGGSGNAYLQLAAAGRQNKRDMDLDTNTRYGNANAQILNQGQYYNAGIGDKEFDANAANRAQSRNIKGNAYSNIGQNIMGQYGDYKQGERDKSVVEMYGNIYEGAQYSPAYQAYLAQMRGKK